MKKLLPFLLLIGCATTPRLPRPEVVFAQASEQVVSILSNECLDDGYVIEQSSNSIVLCSMEDQRFMSAVQMNSAHPLQKLQFNLVPVDGGTRVVATSWLETQTPLGQTQKAMQTGPKPTEQLQQLLDKLSVR